MALLSHEERSRGVWTISAGNAGQGVAYAARAAGVPSTVVVVETAPKSKLERMKALVRHSFQSPTRSLGKRWMKDRLRGLMGHSFIHLMTMISLPVMARWGWKFSKTRQTSPR